MIRVIVDENIPLPTKLDLSRFELIQRQGRSISRSDLSGVDALLVRSVTKVDKDLLDHTGIQFVASATAGIDHLDTSYLKSSGIDYFYAAGSNADSVVDYVLCSLAALGRDPRAAAVGIIGCGQVGGRLYKRMSSLGCDCYCYDPFLSAKEQPDLASLELALQANIVCLHTPLTDSGPYPTRQMISANQLELLADKAVLINAGRGGVINETDLKNLMLKRDDISLVFDVWQDEPDIDRELLALCDIATPHIAGYAAQAKLRGSQQVFQALSNKFGIDQVSFEPDSKNLKSLEAEQWDRALLQVYDPRIDDTGLRTKPESFDQLRKNYPLRAEVSEFQSQDESLQKFGFSRAAL